MPLVYSDDYVNLPTEPKLRWLKLRDLVETRLSQASESMNGSSDQDLVEYCSILASAAEELELGKFESFAVSNIREHYETLRSEVIALATRLSIRGVTENATNSVALNRQARSKISTQISRLRKLISDSDLEDDLKFRLSKKLDELNSLIMSPRTDFGKTFAIIAYLAMFVGGTTTFLADAPNAITTISALIGEAKDAEEEERRLLEAERQPIAIPDFRENGGDPDEIPF